MLMVNNLRESRNDDDRHAGAILKLLVQRIRQDWPKTKIIFRADSGFCRDRVLSWCESNDVDCIVGLARNEVLKREAKPYLNQACEQFERTQANQKLFGGLIYGAKSWKKILSALAYTLLETIDQGDQPGGHRGHDLKSLTVLKTWLRGALMLMVNNLQT